MSMQLLGHMCGSCMCVSQCTFIRCHRKTAGVWTGVLSCSVIEYVCTVLWLPLPPALWMCALCSFPGIAQQAQRRQAAVPAGPGRLEGPWGWPQAERIECRPTGV